MVQFVDPKMTLYPEKLVVKRECDDSFHHHHDHLDKRFKPDFQKSISGPNTLPATSSQNNPLDEHSPLGLTLRKTPSLLDLIQMKLSQGITSTAGDSNSETFDFIVEKETEIVTMSGTTEKLKASNFPASLLKIGRWEYKSRHEGDLVAKCYYAKHKLVWEILVGGLKSKIEVQWSDIMALKANCPDDGPATLNVVLARRPLFFRETNPQPRKHTLWQATADFTGGEASMQRQHFLQCPQGYLNKHFEKLIQCDSRLNFLSRQPEIVFGSPYFEPTASGFTAFEQSSVRGLEQPVNDNRSVVHEMEENRSITKVSSMARKWEQIKVSGLQPSMSMSDLVNHIEQHISEQTTFTKSPFVDDGSECQEMLNEITRYLLSDNQLSAASDEASLMSRVDSLCCLLQKEPPVVQSFPTSGVEGLDYKEDVQLRDGRNSESHIKIHPKETKDVSGSMQPSAMSRKDSFADLLLHLPRIASLPKFLFNISDGDEDEDN
ncbi:hypothetical protein SDJN03_16368, partial [Cucurbita argyrosperma subsp. sororia]